MLADLLDWIQSMAGPQGLVILVISILCGLVLALASGRKRPGPSGSRGLDAVRSTEVKLSTAPIWNASESRVLLALEELARSVDPELRVMAQVGVAGVIAISGPQGPRQSAFNAVRAKRFDFVIADPSGQPLVAVEYQGAGHRDSNGRDEVKRIVCDRADLPLIEIDHREGRGQAMTRIREAISRSRG